MPNSKPVVTATAAVKRSTCPSIVKRIQNGIPPRMLALIHCSRPKAKATPSAAPVRATSTLSVRSCRTTRQPSAPSATRTAISFERAVARASSRLATLAHAMRSTNPTAAIMINSTGRMLPTWKSRSVWTSAPQPSVAARVLRLERGRDATEIALGLLERDRGLEAPDHLPRVIPAILHRVHLHRRPRARRGRELEVGRHHADHGVLHAVDEHLLPDHFAPPAETVVPEAVAQDDHVRRADPIFLFLEVAPERGRHAEGSEHRPRDVATRHEFRAAVARQVVRRPRVDADVGQRPVVGLPTAEVRVRDGVHVPAAPRVRLADRDEPVGVLIREGTQQHRADATENRRVDADAQREAEDGGDGERRSLGQRSNREPNVLEHERAVRGGSRSLRQSASALGLRGPGGVYDGRFSRIDR